MTRPSPSPDRAPEGRASPRGTAAAPGARRRARGPGPRAGGDAPAVGDAPGWSFEARLWAAGHTPVAGVDEAGRGALAGPVVAAAVILPPGEHPFRDSKTLAAARREELAALVREAAVAWAVGRAEAEEVDALGVLRATHVAAGRALARLRRRPGALVTDYLTLAWDGPVLAPPRADGRSLQAAAASLLAKTERDRWMAEVAEERWPGYAFASNKGYGVARHLEALAELGPCPAHRRRFAPVAQARLF